MQSEFRDIGHCGGQVMVHARTDEAGVRKFSMGFQMSSPKPGGMFSINVMENGIPFMTVPMGLGIPIPHPGIKFFPIFIGSDVHLHYGHLCQGCDGYWRSTSAPAYWNMTCPYCGLSDATHNFLTVGQRNFVYRCLELYHEAFQKDEDGETVIDLDKIADEIAQGIEPPKFYYAEKTQQNHYRCDECGDSNDILGRFGFCCCCGTRNDLQELNKKIIPKIRQKANDENDYIGALKEAVSTYDALIGRYAEFLVKNIPMTSSRKSKFTGKRFLNLKQVASDLKEAFDIDIIKGIAEEDTSFAELMFHRRHVYEHKGGAVDEKYLQDSGDTSVKLRQEIHETKATANRFIEILDKVARNLHNGFHGIFPPEQKAISNKRR